MKLEWNELKNRINLEKHGLSFEDAEAVFNSQTVTFLDDRQDYGETRFITLGRLADRIVVLIHTLRGDNIRIISMRKANEREQKIYHEQLKETRQNDRQRH